MKQNQTVCFSSEDNKIKMYCETDVPLGDMHDFLMYMKGYTVDRMVQAHKDELEFSEAQKKTEEIDEAA